MGRALIMPSIVSFSLVSLRFLSSHPSHQMAELHLRDSCNSALDITLSVNDACVYGFNQNVWNSNARIEQCFLTVYRLEHVFTH